MEQVPSPASQPSVAESVPQLQTPPPQQPSMPSLPIKPILLGIGAIVVLLIVIFGVRMILSNLSGQGGTSSGSNRPVTLTYWGLWESNDAIQSVIKDFENQNPGVTIQYSQQSAKDYNERLQSACARGQCPDIFRFHATWTQSYTQKGLLAPVPSSVVSASEFSQYYYPAANTDLKTTQGYMGVPLMTDGLGLYINKRILNASGKSVPTTWDELRVLAGELTVRGANGGIDRAGIALGSAENVDHFSDILGVLILQNGGNPAKPQEGTLVSDALTFYTQFLRSDKVWDETLPNSTYAFAIEKAAMIIAPSWRAFEIKQINPNFEFEIYPIPQLPGKPVAWASYWAEGVAKTSKEQETAWKFLKYMSNPQTLERFHTQASGLRLFGEIYPRTDMADKLTNDKYAGAYVKQAPYAKSWYMASRTFDNGVNDQIIGYYKDAVNKLNTGSASRIETILSTLEQGVTQALQNNATRP